MFLSTKINVWEQDSNREEQINEDDCLCDRLNENNDETVDLGLSDWFEVEDRN